MDIAVLVALGVVLIVATVMVVQAGSGRIGTN